MTKAVAETIQWQSLPVTLLRSRRRTLALEISAHGIIARAPQRLPLKQVYSFLDNKQHWIFKNLATTTPVEPPVELSSGTQLQYLDDCFNLQIEKGSKRTRYHDNTLTLYIKDTDNHLSTSRKLIKWYKSELQKLLLDKVSHVARKLEVSTPDFKVREYKRRWGSCNHKQELSFNWRLIMAPEVVLDYVVLHEVAHLIEFNHTKRFWDIVQTHMPNWQTQRDWLNQHGGQLYRLRYIS